MPQIRPMVRGFVIKAGPFYLPFSEAFSLYTCFVIESILYAE